jgi:hypothetical protein
VDALPGTSPSRSAGYERLVGTWLCKRGRARLRRLLWRVVGERIAAREADAVGELLRTLRPDVVVSTHLSQTYGRSLVAAAARRGIPTVGNLMSWDNVWKGFWTRPDYVTCWSENNRQEICRMEGYPADRVAAIGAPAFDLYLRPEHAWPRERLCSELGLSPERPLLLFATLGQFSQGIDETSPLEMLLRWVDEGAIPGRPQVIVRLHPWSRESYFSAFLRRPDVRVTRYEHYVPGLTWTPTGEETVLAGNLLRHADVLISPGSTMCVESAIFDTPAVVPVVNEYMPEVFDSYFERTWLNKHFGRLYRNGWIPVARTPEEYLQAVNRALTDRSWYRSGRCSIRDEVLGPLDGQATRRLADLITRVAARGGVA